MPRQTRTPRSERPQRPARGAQRGRREGIWMRAPPPPTADATLVPPVRAGWCPSPWVLLRRSFSGPAWSVRPAKTFRTLPERSTCQSRCSGTARPGRCPLCRQPGICPRPAPSTKPSSADRARSRSVRRGMPAGRSPARRWSCRDLQDPPAWRPMHLAGAPARPRRTRHPVSAAACVWRVGPTFDKKATATRPTDHGSQQGNARWTSPSGASIVDFGHAR